MLPSNLVMGRFVVYFSQGEFLGIEKFSSEDNSFREVHLRRLQFHLLSGRTWPINCGQFRFTSIVKSNLMI